MYFCRKINTFVYFAPTQICKYAFFYYYQTVGNDLNKTRWGGVILVQPRPCRVRAESVRRPSHVCVASVRVRARVPFVNEKRYNYSCYYQFM